MTRSYIPLNSLRAFEAAARHLSFTRAAIELNVTHSAISQHVNSLEQQLNCQLFVRGSRGLMLTTEGKVCYLYLMTPSIVWRGCWIVLPLNRPRKNLKLA